MLRNLDWEVEFVVVIGWLVCNVVVEDVLFYVVGYMICNDLLVCDLFICEDWLCF